MAASARQATHRVPATSSAKTIMRGIGMPARQHDQRSAEQIGRERTRRDRLDLAFLGRRAEQEAADDEQRGEHEADDDVEDMRRRSIDGRSRPGNVQSSANAIVVTASQRHSRTRASAEGGGGDDGEIDVERPVVGLVRTRPGSASRRRRPRRARPAPGRAAALRRASPSATSAEQDEGGGRHEEAVERVGGIDGGIGDRGAGRGEDRRDVGDRQRRDRRNALLAARPFAGGKQRQREQRRRGTVRTPGPIRPASME